MVLLPLFVFPVYYLLLESLVLLLFCYFDSIFFCTVKHIKCKLVWAAENTLLIKLQIVISYQNFDYFGEEILILFFS